MRGMGEGERERERERERGKVNTKNDVKSAFCGLNIGFVNGFVCMLNGYGEREGEVVENRIHAHSFNHDCFRTLTNGKMPKEDEFLGEHCTRN